ncbi:PREDICTED: 28S ribosomal protein S29, mitochondrial [Tinamus guttatus]|nr:PREDICTED: 28S ribosomal protein S29, mitochondrial [Tinamus guttatus]
MFPAASRYHVGSAAISGIRLALLSSAMGSCCEIPSALGRALGSAAAAGSGRDAQSSAEGSRAVFRTAESDPANHGELHEGRHYNIALQEVRAVFPHGLPSPFQQQIKTFNEASVMVRKPALELLTYLKSSSFANPVIRYVIYGEKGTGKTMTLCHVVHYCARQGWLVLHVPDAHLWVKNCRQLMQSSYKKDRLDQPLQASSWLKNFKITNEHFLKEIKTQRKYMWGKRECTEEGRPLGEVVEQGLARVRDASDAVGVVLRELKQQSGLGAFRLLVAVDGVNALWGRTTLRKEDKSPVSPEELTLVHNLRKMMVNDWNGGAVVTTLSQTGSLFKPSSAYLPHELLGKVSAILISPPPRWGAEMHEINPLDEGRLSAFGHGDGLMRDPACLEELDDRLHFFVEECDYLQGFQVLCDLHDGFSGVGAKVTELLHDEYSRKGILTFGLTPVIHKTEQLEKDVYRLLNTALGIVHLSTHSSLFCPLSLNSSLGLKPKPPVTFPYLNYDAALDYHSSAVLAAALDTVTVPYRLSGSPCSMLHLAEALGFSGRKVAAALAAVPLPVVHGHSLRDTLRTQQQGLPWKLLSSGGEQQVSRCFAQSVVLRGICKEKPSSSFPGKRPHSALQAYESEEEILQRYLQTLFPGAFSTSHVLEQPCPTLPPYPQFFSPLLTKQGLLLDKPLGSSSPAVRSVPVAAALQSGPVLHALLRGLHRELRALDTRRWAGFFAAGLEEEDFREALHALRALADCYKTHLEADESEDETDSD